MSYNLKTDIAKAKGLGSAKTGSHHWLMQRITGIILVICSIWSVVFVKYYSGKDLTTFIDNLKKPYNIVAITIFILMSFYHAMLGMRVVIEDYISCVKLRNILIIGIQLFTIVTVVALIVAWLY
jgi:succinate dehydrogenase / fumarate reductase, membrane anchor subunit